MEIGWRLVVPEEVAKAWPLAAPYLQEAIERDDGRRSLHSVLVQLVTGQNQLWLVSEPDAAIDYWPWVRIGPTVGAVITAIINYPHQKALKVEWLAGERFGEWSHLISVLKDFARANGCYAVEIAGRPGVVKAMKQFGFEVTGWEARSLV